MYRTVTPSTATEENHIGADSGFVSKHNHNTINNIYTISD